MVQTDVLAEIHFAHIHGRHRHPAADGQYEQGEKQQKQYREEQRIERQQFLLQFVGAQQAYPKDEIQYGCQQQNRQKTANDGPHADTRKGVFG